MTTRFVFYGRVSTEDQQDPESSRAWQVAKAEGLVQQAGGLLVAEYFDIGQSRSLPWRRRPEATRLLLDLADPDRDFDAVVVAEQARAFGDTTDQATTLRVLEHHGVMFWSPDTSGAFDRENISHRLMAGIRAELAQEERATIRRRVRDAMTEQARAGRFLGGRPPYGYLLLDAGQHPNPSKAANGKRLRRLDVDPVSGPVVGRIFGMYLAGNGLGSIAERLNAEGVPSPSAYDPARNRHRVGAQGAGWAKSAIRAILTNPRYVGRNVWNRSHRDETRLLDPLDPALGSDYRQVWNDRGAWVWSTEETHTPLVDAEDFATAQTLLGAAKSQPGSRVRSAKPGRAYALRGLVRCEACGRLLEGCWVNGTPRYRCRLKGSDYARNTALAARHGKCPSVREDRLTRALDALLVRLLDPANAAQVAEAIAAARPGDHAADTQAQAARRTLADADECLTRYRAALDSGGDPAIVGGWIAEAAADKVRAEQNLRALGPREQITADDVLELLDRLGPIGERLGAADPVLKARVYADLGLEITWSPGESRAHVTVTPSASGGVYVRRVGGGT